MQLVRTQGLQQLSKLRSNPVAQQQLWAIAEFFPLVFFSEDGGGCGGGSRDWGHQHVGNSLSGIGRHFE